MISAVLVGNLIKKLRCENGITQQQLADALMVSRSAVANWEVGNRIPEFSLLTRLAKCFHVETSVFTDALRGPDDPPKVLVVEDVAVVLRGTVRMLERELPAAEVYGFVTAAEALEFARSCPVSVAFLDIELPGENGMGLGQELAAINPRTNIIYLTNYAEYGLEAARSHCSGYILKPLTPELIHGEMAHLRFAVRGLTP